MKPHYILNEVAHKLELNQRAEVKDVLEQILYPDDDNPALTVSVFFINPVRLITRGKIEHGEEDYWSLPAEGSACVTLSGLFDIKVLPRTPIEEILNKPDVKNCRWPDGHGLYPLNSRRPKGLVVVLVQDGIAYELQDKITLRESDLVISRENLGHYAKRRGITLRADDTESSSKEMNPSGDCGEETGGEKEPYTQEEAAALVGREPGTILNLLTSRGPHSRPLTLHEGGKQAKATAAIEVESILRNTVARTMARDRKLSFMAHADGMRIVADEDRFAAVLSHLIDNAIDATSAGTGASTSD